MKPNIRPARYICCSYIKSITKQMLILILMNWSSATPYYIHFNSPTVWRHFAKAVCSLCVTCRFILFFMLTENMKYIKYICIWDSYSLHPRKVLIVWTLLYKPHITRLLQKGRFGHFFFFCLFPFSLLAAHIICAMPKEFTLCLIWCVPVFLRSDIDYKKRGWARVFL